MSFPSTPTISTPSDLTPSPETPPTLLPAFFTPRALRHTPAQNLAPTTRNRSSDDEMAPMKLTELFCGNAPPKRPICGCTPSSGRGNTMQRRRRRCTVLRKACTWEVRRRSEEVGEAPGDPAVTGRVIAELANNCLDREVLRKYVNDGDGVLVLSHIAWAEVTCGLLGELPSGDVGMMVKLSIQATLPVEFRHLPTHYMLEPEAYTFDAASFKGADRGHWLGKHPIPTMKMKGNKSQSKSARDEIAKWFLKLGWVTNVSDGKGTCLKMPSGRKVA
ncbi:hypothetical protein B0H10DRAFT_1944616 [Mycena sp. CBHHK59/15]|nr:hypothetical protein B0H10DRAFT_1944616 [Mycena sp. CBHHK59/15]